MFLDRGDPQAVSESAAPQRAGALDTPAMTSRPSTEQLLVQVLMRSAQEVLRALAEQGADAPERVQAQRELELAFEPIWSRLPHLELAVTKEGITWQDQVVLALEEDVVGLNATLIRSGIHGLAFVPGAEQKEIHRFLELVDQIIRLDEDGDQDLVMMLFRADLLHIRYTVGAALDAPASRVAGGASRAEAGSTEAAPRGTDSTMECVEDRTNASFATIDLTLDLVVPTQPLELIEPADLKEAVREDAETDDDKRGVVQLEKFDSTLYFLDKREIEYLKTGIDQQYKQDRSGNVLSLLLDVLQLQSAPAVRDEVIGVLKTLLPYLLGTGRFGSVAYLTSEIRKIAREVDMEPRHKKALDELRVSLSQSDALTQLFHALDDGNVRPTAESLGVLLRELRQEALQTVLVWIGQLTTPETKSALVSAVDDFFTRWPNALERMLTSTDRTVVHRALGIAHKLKSPEFAEAVGGVLDHEDDSTRQLAARTLLSIGTPPALRRLYRMVEDPDRDVRTTVFEGLAVRPYRGAEEGLREAIEAGDLEQKDVGERRALFSAYGAVAGAGGVAALETVLAGRGGFGRRRSPETRACAAVALGMINTPTARSALEKAAKDRDPVVRTAANAALRVES